jgi:hypothetical protein
MGAAQFGSGENKKGNGLGAGERRRSIVERKRKTILLVSRARGLKHYIFFLLIIGFKGCSIYNTMV